MNFDSAVFRFVCSVIAVIAGLSVLAGVTGCSPREIPERAREGDPDAPNVVLIVLDTLRPDYLDMHGFDRETAPFLRELGEESVVFDNVFSTSSWTAPATASIMTSMYPTQHGLTIGFIYQRGIQEAMTNNSVDSLDVAGTTVQVPEGGLDIDKPAFFQVLPEELDTIPELLQARGYMTYAISANPNISSSLQFDQGFDKFEFIDHGTADQIYETLKDMRREVSGSAPYFLYLHLMDPHRPYHKREPFYVEQDTPEGEFHETYISEIPYMDGYLERMYDLMDMDENTIVMVTSDHGEEFWEHGNINHGPTLFRELNAAMLMVRAEGVTPQRVPQNVSLIDILPTLVEMTGAPAPTQPMEGVSLVPIFGGGNDAETLASSLEERMLFAHRVRARFPNTTQLWAAIHGDRKLITDELEGRVDMLFDLERDRREARNLIRVESETYARLKAALDTFREGNVMNPEVQVQSMDEDLEESLESLGYVQ